MNCPDHGDYTYPERQSAPVIPSAYRLFFQESLKALHPTASVLPSSRFLANALVSQIDFQRARTIVELGPGTGVVTNEILRRLRNDGRLLAIDVNQAFIAHLRAACDDPRLMLLCGHAEDLKSLLASNNVDSVDAVVSSLGLTHMHGKTRKLIVKQIRASLLPGGLMTQYQYMAHIDIRRLGRRRFDEARFLRKFFRDVSVGRVVLNFPPANVFTCRM